MIKLKIFKNNTNVVDIYENKVENICDYIKPNSKVKALIRCNGLWCFENKWGLSWKVCKLSVKSSDTINTDSDCSFID